MKISKFLIGSFVLASVFSACTQDELLQVADNDATLAQRTQVNLSLSIPAETRMGLNAAGGIGYTANDVLGAVLVDRGYVATAGNNVNDFKNVNWELADGHVGNNKWQYNTNTGKFETAGTTAIGQWLFYTKYQAENTTSRDGVKFPFPQIQEGAADRAWLANNNINFHVSPVMAIDGYEKEDMKLNVRMNSVYNYLNIKLKFAKEIEATKVNKILVRADVVRDNAGALTSYDDFSAKYKVVNAELPKAPLVKATGAPTAIAAKEYDGVPGISETDLNFGIFNAALNMQGRELKPLASGYSYTSYQDMTSNVPAPGDFTEEYGNVKYEYLVVDCDGQHSAAAGTGMAVAADSTFNTFMLMPAGEYTNIELEIYTDKGVYRKVVAGSNYYKENNSVTPNTDPLKLYPNRATSLANTGFATLTANEIDYVKIKATDIISGNVVAKTADLINFINGIKLTPGHNGRFDVNVISQAAIGTANGVDDQAIPEHALIVNKAVMDALNAKETALNKDLHLDFKGAKVKILGETAEALDVHSMSFHANCETIGGKVLVDSEFETAILDITNNSIVTIDSTKNDTGLAISNVRIDATSSATLNTHIAITVTNKGTLTVNRVNPASTVKNEKTMTISAVDRVGADNVTLAKFENEKNATLAVNDTLTINGTSYNKGGEINNNSVINIQGVFKNEVATGTPNVNGVINNPAGKKFLVNSNATASFTNDAIFNNSGSLYTQGITNTIKNTGTINAALNSITYITTNSKESETAYAFNDATVQKLGTIVLAARDMEVTVTEPTYQGYKQYTVVASDLVDGVLDVVDGVNDKFNKVILSASATLSDDIVKYVHFVKTNSNLTLPAKSRIQDLEFTASATLYAKDATSSTDRVVVSQLTVAKDATLFVPTTNVVYVYDMNSFIQTSKSLAKIINKGEILVGGKFITELTQPAAGTNGIFSSGHSQSSAAQSFFWNTPW